MGDLELEVTALCSNEEVGSEVRSLEPYPCLSTPLQVI